MKNVVLIGMPGSGKSTVGVVLAKVLGYRFIDSDLVIQEAEGKLLHEIISEKGIDGFLAVENKINSELEPEHSVIATGGSAVFGKRGMANLEKCSHIVYLKVSLAEIENRVGDLVQRGVVLNGCKDVAELYDQRVPLYEHYGKIVIECDGKTVEQCVDEIIDLVKEQEQ